MEDLSAKVYECNLAVEAHMICDLLSQAGISARVDGEFMQGIAGEIPLGNTVKVRVAPEKAAEAREVIADWEKQQPPESATVAVAKPSRFKLPLWFFLGVLVGATAVFAAYRNLGVANETFDRNDDGRTDARWIPGWSGYVSGYEEDNDFDGRYELQSEVDHNGFMKRALIDTDGDGRPEQVWHFTHGVIGSIDYHFASGGRVVKREFYKRGLRDSAEFDDDGDGRFERRVQYDALGEPPM
jgi:hypothetical protein